MLLSINLTVFIYLGPSAAPGFLADFLFLFHLIITIIQLSPVLGYSVFG